MSKIATIGVIGAGIAGLSCAAALLEAGCTVSLFDKGRRTGGRVATRRADGLLFDHGAQYATARDAGFRALLAGMQTAGVAAPWPAAGTADDPRWVGVPGMSALPRFMADRLEGRGVTIAAETHAAFLHAGESGWQVRHLPAAQVRPGTVTDQGGTLAGPFDAVVVALPSAQAAPLLAPILPSEARKVEACTVAPCWAVMAAFPTRVDAPDTQRREDGPLGWIARDSSRPGRAALPDTWMLHASAAWSRDNLERPAADIAAELLAAFAATLSVSLPEPVHLSAHRWRYALVETPLGEPCLWNATRRIGLCGDWCLGPRVEAAFLSGRALATAMHRGT